MIHIDLTKVSFEKQEEFLTLLGEYIRETGKVWTMRETGTMQEY